MLPFSLWALPYYASPVGLFSNALQPTVYGKGRILGLVPALTIWQDATELCKVIDDPSGWTMAVS